jgi:uncharacterized protein YciI
MQQFIIQCNINSESSAQLNALRPSHLQYIKSKSNILYGGIMLEDADSYKGICYVIKANSMAEAEAFVKDDPYFDIYRNFEISLFIQKIPLYENGKS